MPSESTMLDEKILKPPLQLQGHHAGCYMCLDYRLTCRILTNSGSCVRGSLGLTEPKVLMTDDL